MTIIYQSIMMGALLLIAASLIVFPILFLVQFHGFRKDFRKAFLHEENEDTHHE